ncbi:MAG: presqualene diphosphate synthase HpnD [Betaproteobacteria bacterium]|nr:presqualene diphosphate synthase HpnD [Betaproteobacteria bacterium]
MTPHQYCQQKAAQSGSSFYYSFLFLPKPRREAITAMYAFCREVDDVVDEVKDVDVARATLGWWRAEVDNLFNGHPSHPVTQALKPCLADHGITRERMLLVIDGMEMDLVKHRYADFTELEKYCYLVAGVVGELSAGIFGFQNTATLNYARNLGMAFQLTNIIRDVGEDARRDRIYLPREDLAQFNVGEEDLLKCRETAGFDALMRFQTERARRYYRAARAALPADDRRAQRPGLIMAAIYSTLLDEIEADGFHVLNQRISLTPLRKFWLAWKTWVSA